MFIIGLYKTFSLSLCAIIVESIINGKDKETGINGILSLQRYDYKYGKRQELAQQENE
jgi:hypothetical protein